MSVPRNCLASRQSFKNYPTQSKCDCSGTIRISDTQQCSTNRKCTRGRCMCRVSADGWGVTTLTLFAWLCALCSIQIKTGPCKSMPPWTAKPLHNIILLCRMPNDEVLSTPAIDLKRISYDLSILFKYILVWLK